MDKSAQYSASSDVDVSWRRSLQQQQIIQQPIQQQDSARKARQQVSLQKYSPELSPSPSEDRSSTEPSLSGKNHSRNTSQSTSFARTTNATSDPGSSECTKTSDSQLGFQSKISIASPSNQSRVHSAPSVTTSPSRSPSNSKKKSTDASKKASSILRTPFPARAPPPPRSVAQLEEAMMDLKVYDSCLFWGKSGAVNLKPEGNSWDDDMVIQSKDPAWVRNLVQPPLPTNQELLILPPIAKVERSIEVFHQNAHLYPPFITPLIVERAKQTRSDQTSRILLNTITGIAIRIDPSIENAPGSGSQTNTDSEGNKAKYMRYFNRAYGLLIHLEDIRSTYSTVYLQATLLLCFVYPKPQLRVELLKLMTEAAFLGLHIDASRWMPKPIVIQNRCWLFWTCYMFDSVHHVIRGQLTQMDDLQMDPLFPALTELDNDYGLWTRWFMVKEINLWRIGRKIHSFFQAELKHMDQLIEFDNMDDNRLHLGLGLGLDQASVVSGFSESDQFSSSSLSNNGNSALRQLSNVRALLSNEFSEAELKLSLKFWADDLPLHLTAQLNDLDQLDPRVNGRAMGLQVVFSMLRILLLYPSVLTIGTKLLSSSPNYMMMNNNNNTEPSSSNQSPGNLQFYRYQQSQKHQLRRQMLLEKITQCIQEADRIILHAWIIMDRYPERARISCVNVALDWCLRIYFKVIVEEKTKRSSTPDTDSETDVKSRSQTPTPEKNGSRSGSSTVNEDSPFSPALKSRCRVQVTKVERLLKLFDELDHRNYFSWLTIEPDALEIRQRENQRKMVERCMEGLSADYTTATSNHDQPLSSAQTSNGNGSDALPIIPSNRTQQQQQQYHQHQRPLQPKMHSLEETIKKRQQMGVYANSGFRPNGGNYVDPNGTSQNISSSISGVSSMAPGAVLSPNPIARNSVGNGGIQSSGVISSGSSEVQYHPMSTSLGASSGVYPTPIIGPSTPTYPGISFVGDRRNMVGISGTSLPTASHQPIYKFEYNPSTQSSSGFQNGPTSNQYSVQPHSSPMPVYQSGESFFATSSVNGMYTNLGDITHSAPQGVMANNSVIGQPPHHQQQRQQQLQQHSSPKQQQHGQYPAQVSLDSIFE
ncbi:hypothetical protein BGZ76_009562 [Entomortierella beljakovae]|nr:hypothetical protein BGZ76_009562 [Entomortierella beljakovae]